MVAVVSTNVSQINENPFYWMERNDENLQSKSTSSDMIYIYTWPHPHENQFEIYLLQNREQISITKFRFSHQPRRHQPPNVTAAKSISYILIESIHNCMQLFIQLNLEWRCRVAALRWAIPKCRHRIIIIIVMWLIELCIHLKFIQNIPILLEFFTSITSAMDGPAGNDRWAQRKFVNGK